MIHVVTVITDEQHEGYAVFLKRSAQANHLKVTTITIDFDENIGYREKDRHLKAFLETVADDEVVLFTDGYDVIFVASAEEILLKFRKFGKSIVFSAETNCWPDPDLSARYGQSHSTIYRYLNSGGFIGEAGAIKKMLHGPALADDVRFPWSNQYYWTLRYLHHADVIGIDNGCEIFCTMSPESGSMDMHPADYLRQKKEWFSEHFSISEKRVFNKLVSSWPCHLHFNGAAKCLMDEEMFRLLIAG